MIRVHAKAIVDAAKAAFMNSFDSDEIPTPPPYPHMVIYMDTGRPTGHRQSGPSGARAWRFETFYVGRTADEARGVAELADAAFDRKRITVAGWRCGLITAQSSQSVGRDPDSRDQEGNSLFTGSTVWTFGSSRVVAP